MLIEIITHLREIARLSLIKTYRLKIKLRSGGRKKNIKRIVTEKRKENYKKETLKISSIFKIEIGTGTNN